MSLRPALASRELLWLQRDDPGGNNNKKTFMCSSHIPQESLTLICSSLDLNPPIVPHAWGPYSSLLSNIKLHSLNISTTPSISQNSEGHSFSHHLSWWKVSISSASPEPLHGFVLLWMLWRTFCSSRQPTPLPGIIAIRVHMTCLFGRKERGDRNRAS